MDISELLKDALRYPFSDWKKILIYGILILIGNIITFITFIGTFLGIKDVAVKIILFITGYIIFGFLINGYKFKIIKTSLDGVGELPKFNNWLEIFINGIKVYLVTVVYLLPGILIIIFAGLSLLPTLVGLGSNLSSININTFLSFLTAAILVFIALLYMLIILPINYMAIAHMANNNSELRAAFKVHDIIDKIRYIGWGNLILWYLVIGTIYIIISIVGTIITGIFSIINPIVSIILNSLILYPYLDIYLNRSIALFYMSKKII